MEQCSKTSREGKEPDCLKVMLSWLVKRICQACLLGTGLVIQEIPAVTDYCLSVCLPASCSVYHHMTTTARNSQLPLVSRGVGSIIRQRTSDAGQVQKSPAELCYEAYQGLKCSTPGKKWENTPCLIWSRNTPRHKGLEGAQCHSSCSSKRTCLSVGLILSVFFVLNSSFRVSSWSFTVSECYFPAKVALPCHWACFCPVQRRPGEHTLTNV